MPTISPGSANLYMLLPGESLTITTDSASSCTYGQLQYPAATPDVPGPAGLVSVSSSTTITIGPRGDASRWGVYGAVGTSVTVTKNLAASVPDAGAPPDVMHIFGSGAPGAAVGANHAQSGSLYTDFAAGKLYINSGSKAAPSWRLVTSA